MVRPDWFIVVILVFNTLVVGAELSEASGQHYWGWGHQGMKIESQAVPGMMSLVGMCSKDCHLCPQSHWSSDLNYPYFSLPGDDRSCRGSSVGGRAMVGPARAWGWGAPLTDECHGDGCNVFIISSPLLLEITRVSVSWGRSLPPRQRGKCLIITMAATIPTSLAALQLLFVLLRLVLFLLLLQPFWSQVNLSTISTSNSIFAYYAVHLPPLLIYSQAEFWCTMFWCFRITE